MNKNNQMISMSFRRSSAALSGPAIVVGAILATALVASGAMANPQPASARTFIEGLHHKFDAAVAKTRDLDKLHGQIGAEMKARFDYLYMAERILGAARYKGLADAKRAEFVDLLEKMVLRTYVKRFKPGKKVTVKYDDRVRVGKEGRVQVRSSIRVKRTRADVWYSMRPVDGRWKIYDIVVDEASQLRTYRRSFNKVLKKDGWDALIAKMKKSAARK